MRDDTAPHDHPAEPGTTAYLLQEMQLFGHRPFEDEPDPRPLPDAHLAGGAVADLERLFATFPGDFGELQHQADIRFGERGELINGIGHETVNLSLRV